jgi:hypothetical protein
MWESLDGKQWVVYVSPQGNPVRCANLILSDFLALTGGYNVELATIVAK